MDKDNKLETTVRVDDKKEYGWFEIYDLETGGQEYYVEGGLWFEGKNLIDYDGVTVLPESVEKSLKTLGYVTEA